MEDATYTRGLAEYIAGSRFEDLPKPLVEHVKLLVLDMIGVGVFGASLPWSERLRATAEAMEAPGRAGVTSTEPRHARRNQRPAEETGIRRGGREGGSHPPR